MRYAIVLLALTFVLSGCGQETKEEKDARLCDDEISAFVMATQFVESSLRSPSTADFPYYSDQEVQVVMEPNCRFTVLGYVDAQNGFGATIRQRWIVKLKYLTDGRYSSEEILFE